MFESLTPDPGNEGLFRAAKIFNILAILNGLGALVYLTVLVSEPGAKSFANFVVVSVSAALAYVTAKGIDTQRPWAKRLAYLQGVLMLFSFPVGTFIAVFVLVYVYRASMAGLFRTSTKPAA